MNEKFNILVPGNTFLGKADTRSLQKVRPDEAVAFMEFVKTTKDNALYSNCMSRMKLQRYMGEIPTQVFLDYEALYGVGFWTKDKGKNIRRWLAAHPKFKV